MTLRTSDLAIFDSLSVVHLDGFEPAKELVRCDDGTLIDDTPPDPPGTANWLCYAHGMAPGDGAPGILWTDYDAPESSPWRFSVLIASDEVEDLSKLATESGYEVRRVEPITEPTTYGDGSGVCTILKHPDGWVVAQ